MEQRSHTFSDIRLCWQDRVVAARPYVIDLRIWGISPVAELCQ
jgi:hypothetical protein